MVQSGGIVQSIPNRVNVGASRLNARERTHRSIDFSPHAYPLESRILLHAPAKIDGPPDGWTCPSGSDIVDASCVIRIIDDRPATIRRPSWHTTNSSYGTHSKRRPYALNRRPPRCYQPADDSASGLRGRRRRARLVPVAGFRIRSLFRQRFNDEPFLLLCRGSSRTHQ